MRKTALLLLFFLATALAGDAPWLTDWDAAREKAKKEGKPIVCVTLAPG